MQKTNAEILHHFYSLLLEMNFHESEEDPPTAEEIADSFIQKHLRQVKLKIARNRAELKRTLYQSILQEIDRLRKISANELKKILTPQEALQLQPLFSKFESMTLNDKESIAEDQELLQLITALKDKLNKTDRND
ncbi:hypothetical protein [Pinibacter aurantiacus]|uniref:Uncharacterized protein n=1 Tax=Pinibacter aurantiacus TaxID=2851599 RepID=A0A9E2W8N5_9BACT|nr:hypothetical protein [Pinibacter aurantiacus]MBV4358786.1 hypothetical protein [Pinibacter aurantiacus]